MRERIQSGGARGGGATSCDQRDADLAVKNTESLERGGNVGRSSSSGGYRVARKGSKADTTASGSSPSKSGMD